MQFCQILVIALLFFLTFKNSQSQCIIQTEMCFCTPDHSMKIYRLTCDEKSQTRQPFPHQDIKNTLDYYPFLMGEMYMRNKNYETIPARAFANLTFNRLILNLNNIYEIDAHAFQASLTVNELDLSVNKIADLNFLKHTKNLIKANFSTNEIRELRNDTFLGLGRLETLILSWNQIASIETASFRDMSRLASLDLSYNKIQTLAEHFRWSQKLSLLDLTKNQIKNLEVNSFSGGLGQLSRLDLSQNQLEIIKTDAFSKDLANLKYLNLDNNMLREIAPNAQERTRFAGCLSCRVST
jgi:hypothetical protein